MPCSHPPEHFFCVSTDKAANPANVMGASKKLMEEAVLAYAAELPATTARFANVAFCNGSLPDGFLAASPRGSRCQRAFGRAPLLRLPAESGELCLIACVLGEPGDILFPQLDSPTTLTFSSIADALLEELGYTPVQCASEDEARETAPPPRMRRRDTWPVYYFESDTSGEKPVEEFYTTDEDVDLERFEALGVVQGGHPRRLTGIRSCATTCANSSLAPECDKDVIVDELTGLVPTFQHVETGAGLDPKM